MGVRRRLDERNPVCRNNWYCDPASATDTDRRNRFEGVEAVVDRLMDMGPSMAWPPAEMLHGVARAGCFGATTQSSRRPVWQTNCRFCSVKP